MSPFSPWEKGGDEGRFCQSAISSEALLHACAVALLWLISCGPAQAQTSYMLPPRNVDDILAVLEQYKPDPTVAEKARAAASRLPPETTDKAELAAFYLERSYAARNVGLGAQERADLRLALQNARRSSDVGIHSLNKLRQAEEESGSLLLSLRFAEQSTQDIPASWPTLRMNAYLGLIRINIALGDVASARLALTKSEEVFKNRITTNPPDNVIWYEHQRIARIESIRATMYEAESKYIEAERSARRGLQELELDLPIGKQRANARLLSRPYDENSVASSRDATELDLARILLLQGKLSEAEMSARNALSRILGRVGRYSELTGSALRMLASIILEQGRYREAERLGRAAIDIYQNAGAVPESQNIINCRRSLGIALVAQRRWQDALAEFDTIDGSVRGNAELAQRYALRDVNWGLALVKTGHAEKAVPMLDTLSKRTSERLTDAAYESAATRGFLALALAADGQRDRALGEFRRAVPVLLEYARERNASENGGVMRVTHLHYILEGYIGLLSDMWREQKSVPDFDPVSESFRIADAARGSDVQRALTASASRASINDPNLANLARQEQDALTRLGILTNLLARLVSAPPQDQLPKIIADMRKEIESLRADRVKFKAEIEKRFPDYANLIDPKPATVQQTRAALRAGEALVSIYVGEDNTYVWAIPKEGSLAFAIVPRGDKAIAQTVTQLRTALDANPATINDIPKFDIALAHQLYSDLLQPVEAGWGHAKSLLIVPHRALGQIPFALLPTAAVTQTAKEVVPFESYRSVPWLARRVAVTQLPSVNAFVTLRSVPAASANRREFIGFGDPYFSKEQQTQAANESGIQVASRGMQLRNLAIGKVAFVSPAKTPEEQKEGVASTPMLRAVANSSTLAQLARLPDTAQEIRDIAQALKADLAADVFLGVQANEKNVKSIDLSNRKVIAFATHGLVPGDLNGLEQPALALSAPEVSGADGDGLLTMDEILGLKLNAVCTRDFRR